MKSQAIDGDLIFSGQQGDFQSRINMGKGSAGLAAKSKIGLVIALLITKLRFSWMA